MRYDMRVATFNILHGRTPGHGVDVTTFADCIRSLDVDLLALQEVDVDQPRSARADLTAVAADAMGAVSQRFAATISGTPGAVWAAATGAEQPGASAYGVALLSRYPVRDWHVVYLPRLPLVTGEEPRVALAGRFDTPLGTLTVASTHLSFVPGWNRYQLRRLLRDLAAFPGPRMLLGDLNMPRAAAQRWSRLRSMACAPTFPAHRPTRQLDHVLTDHPGLQVRRCSTPELAISDHRPLVVDVDVAAGARWHAPKARLVRERENQDDQRDGNDGERGQRDQHAAAAASGDERQHHGQPGDGRHAVLNEGESD